MEKQKVITEKVKQIGELKEEINSNNVTLKRKERELKSKTEHFSNLINNLEIKINSKEKETEMKNNDLKSRKLNNQTYNVNLAEKVRILENDKDLLKKTIEKKDSEIERIKCISLKNKEIFLKQKETNQNLMVEIEDVKDDISKIKSRNLLTSQNKDPRIKCETCDELFKTAVLLKRHVKVMH